jgi:DNA-binding response OmpR family regulator
MQVLCLSADPELALLRCNVLRSRGIDVDYPATQADADKLIVNQHYEAVLLCHTIPTVNASRLLHLFRERNPSSRVIYIFHAPNKDAPVDCDLKISGNDGPEALLRAISSCDQSEPGT